MELGKKIKSFYLEAELYSDQGLLNEALERYNLVEDLIKANSNIRNREKLLLKIEKKRKLINKKLEKIDGKRSKNIEVSKDTQSLMKEMFSFDDPKIKGSSSLGGAISLAKFGQYDKAIEEFNRLLEYDHLRLEAAKNILWCWLQQNYEDYAISLFQKWQKKKTFPESEMESIQFYFRGLLKKKGCEKTVTDIEMEKTIEPDSEVEDEDIIDITAIRFDLSEGSLSGETVDFEVSFQSGKYIQMIMPKKEKKLLKSIRSGDMLKEIIFYSPMAIFSGTGFVSKIKEISSGPKRGDYSLEIKIINILS